MLALPWIITFGPDGDEDSWEPVVCGPYERAHAMSIAETVVADEPLLAVVEPVQPFATVDEIRREIEQAIADAEEADAEEDDIVGSLDDDEDEFDEEGLPEIAPTPPPSPAEVRAGFARIASRLSAGV